MKGGGAKGRGKVRLILIHYPLRNHLLRNVSNLGYLHCQTSGRFVNGTSKFLDGNN